MSLSLLQLRLKQNEEDFARISGIDLDPNIKDVQKKMPAENNPWSGELKARRQKSRDVNQGSRSCIEAASVEPLTKQTSGSELSSEKQSGVSGEAPTQQTEEMIKLTRKNLKPVLQPFKRAENTTEEGSESPVDVLLRHGDLRGRQGDQSKERESEKARKESEEYLMVNFPADVRKNLKGIILPQTKTEEEKEKKSVIERQVESKGKVLTKEPVKNEDEWAEDEWEWEEEEEEAEEVPTGKAQITISENLVTIDRSKVDWSDDEFEEEDDVQIPAPPPPPAPPAPPPPPPPGLGLVPDRKVSSMKSEKIEQLKKKPAKRPDWSDLMKEIGQFRGSCHGLLKKIVTDDRSKPILSKDLTKIKGVFVYESEKHSKDADILKEINKGIKLNHVKCNDRSKPNLKGIKSFKRQITKEEKLDKGFSFGDDDNVGELEDLDKLKDDLEATKQLLELEVRSKALLEKDNKRLQQEIERLKVEFANVKTAGGESQAPPDILNNILTRERKESISKERRDSMIEKRKSLADNQISDIIASSQVPTKVITEEVPEEVQEEMDELKEEAEEAKKLAEEWEAKYKDMQKQMESLDTHGGMFSKKTSTADKPSFQRLQSTNSEGEGDLASNRLSVLGVEDDDEDWMQKREVAQLQTKIKNMRDKKEIIVKERNFLNERIDNLKDCIAKEFEARKTLKKDIREMNAAFTEEMAEIDHDLQVKKDLEDCAYDEEDLVVNPYAKKIEEVDEVDEEFAAYLEKDDDMEEDIDEILRSAEEYEEYEPDSGAHLFEKFIKNEESDIEEEEPESTDYPKLSEYYAKKIEHEAERVKLMRQSNFGLKSKIDILYDILQTQKEKHYDLKQELNRMLSDV